MERLADVWRSWIEGGVPTALIVLALVLGAVIWLAACMLSARVAARHHRGVFGWVCLVALVPVVAPAGAGLLWPGSFPWFAAGAGLVAALLAVLVRWLIQRSVAHCPSGHELAPDWVHCPLCVPLRAAAPPRPMRMPAGPMGSPVGVAVGAMPAHLAAPQMARAPIPPHEVMVRLIAESSGVSDQVVGTRGALLGRNPAAEIALDDQVVSWEHARIIDRGGSPAVVDLGSANGTYVNDERVETSLLISGDRLRVGETVFRVVS